MHAHEILALLEHASRSQAMHPQSHVACIPVETPRLGVSPGMHYEMLGAPAIQVPMASCKRGEEREGGRRVFLR